MMPSCCSLGVHGARRAEDWCLVVAPRKPPQAPNSSQAAIQPAASKPGPNTIPPAKRTKAEQAAEPTQPTKGKGKAQGKAAYTKPTPQPGRWLDRDCNAALNMQRIGESRWHPLELCWWPEQTALSAKGKGDPGLGYKQVRDKPPKVTQQQQLVVAQHCAPPPGFRTYVHVPCAWEHNFRKHLNRLRDMGQRHGYDVKVLGRNWSLVVPSGKTLVKALAREEGAAGFGTEGTGARAL
ncbi:hypothetical protein QJQ45_006260 [Haematococcus lacustris]|nr:hypothetical protein QJQ45_006260 [Haematococcus lacustris]